MIAMRIIYGVCSWGLGHATRSLPVIRKLISENHDLTIISHGRSIDLLKRELDENIEYIDIPDYPMLLSDNSRQFLAKSMIYWPKFVARLRMGWSRLNKILEKRDCDRIISDARYEIYNRHIPSFFISHQMRIMNPLRIHMFENGSEIFNSFFFKKYAGVIVPDFREDTLSGDLSHNLHRIDEKMINYVGVLSDFNKKNVKKDIDYLISITGPEPQRSIFEKKIMSQIDKLNGKIVVTLGKTEEDKDISNENVKVYSYLSKEEREDLLNRSKLVISRSGYSTILDLAVIGTKALMSPTPGQVEQEYLSEFHNDNGTFYSVDQQVIDLGKDVDLAKKTTGIQKKCDVNKAVEKIMNIIN